ncbi:MAG: tyrosine-type recombinase/integrase [Chromatiaceae bacterium]|nr:tyrosine-type recombinase/integrase [Chromatiaceae bacterium]MBP6807732.1 tyrosine-type recombinase/integrase [Chromatiaceae bacterium]MBP8282540.1 tyrosine-type recombinase/integrase [Chromatiaceae bacterium]MBP9603102.1 tyrosine-type recombinase/integrase [Chromatiaceae bacterium]
MKRIKERLTPTRINNFNPEEEAWLYDTESHLAVRAAPLRSGDCSKTYYFVSTLAYKIIRASFGDVRVVELPDAKSKALKWQGWIKEGKDPREVIKEEERRQAAEEQARLLADQAAREAQAETERLASEEARRRSTPALIAWDVYLADRWSSWGEASRNDHLRLSQAGGKPITRGRRSGPEPITQPGILRPLLLRPLLELHKEAVEAWVEREKARRGTQLALARRLGRAFINWAKEHSAYADLIHEDAFTARMVRDKLPKRGVKDDSLQREQLKPWFEKVRLIPNPYIAAFLQISLLTGARREELLNLRWEDVHFQWKTLHIADKLEEGGRTIPMTPYVLRLLRDLKARNETPPPIPRSLRPRELAARPPWQPSSWIFPSPTAASGRLQEPRIQHKAACDAAGIEGLTIHGLRRSFASLSEWVEVPTGVVAQVMGHKPSATAERHYKRRPVDLLRLWHTKIEDWVLVQAGIPQPQDEEVPGLRAVG